MKVGLLFVVVAVAAGADCSNDEPSNETQWTKNIARHCLAHGDDPSECKELGLNEGYDACTPQAVKDKCPAMCFRCPIAPSLWVILAILISLSFGGLAFLWRRQWLHFERVDHALLTACNADENQNSRILLVTRSVSLLYTFGIVVNGFAHGYLRHWSYVYFTIWNYTTLVVVFGLLLAHSVFKSVPRWLTCLTWSLFQVELTNALMLDCIYWLLLYDGCGLEFVMVNVHFVNALFILTEFGLNKVVLARGQVIFVALYAVVYTIITWILYLNGYNTPYAFLRVGPDSSPIWYIALMIGVVVVFFGVRGLSLLKQKYLMRSRRAAYMSLDSVGTEVQQTRNHEQSIGWDWE